MTDILELMRMGTQARYKVKMRDFEIWFRPLTIAETIQIAAETGEDIQKQPLHARNPITEHVIFSVKTLHLASTSAPGKSDAKLTTHTLQSLTPDELAFLMKEYCAGNDRINPSLETLSTARLDELIAGAKKNDSLLIELSFLELVNICRSLLKS